MEVSTEIQVPEPSPVIREIQTRMAKLDRGDEIMGAVNAMRDAVGARISSRREVGDSQNTCAAGLEMVRQVRGNQKTSIANPAC